MKARLRWIKVLSPTCREAVRLQSDSLDRTLPFPERLGLRLHLLLCKWCRRYARQIRFLREALRCADEKTAVVARIPLPVATRDQLKARLRQERK